MLTDVRTVNLIFFPVLRYAVSKCCVLLSKLIYYNPQANFFALVYKFAFRIDNSTQYGRLETNGKPLKTKTQKTLQQNIFSS